MATWKETSLDSLAAAKELLAAGHWRSAVSRAYYAVYGRVCQELQHVADFPDGREGPSHEDLPDMMYDYLTRLSLTDRRSFAAAMNRMYQRRLVADYRPSRTLNEAASRDSLTWTQGFFNAMEAAYD